ncbi:fimbrial protein, partial [Escherichia coli]|nr:fimbrial protein [Escherichia coli]
MEQDELLEVNLYGRSLGVHRVLTTPTTVKFSSVEEILEKINVKQEKKEDLRSLLLQSYSRNGNMSCNGFDEKEYSCNYIRTDTVNVIVDEENNELNLFIGASFLSVQAQDNIYYQKNINSEKAFIHSQTINFSESEGYKSLSLKGVGAQGLTENSYLVFGWDAIYNSSR